MILRMYLGVMMLILLDSKHVCCLRVEALSCFSPRINIRDIDCRCACVMGGPPPRRVGDRNGHVCSSCCVYKEIYHNRRVRVFASAHVAFQEFSSSSLLHF
jgi:hypothetical protein